MSIPNSPRSNVAPMPVESQSERRWKYGLNVAVMIVLAIVVAVLCTWAFERKPKRFDTTASGMYSLKPQTINLISSNPQKIKITSLYTKAKQGQGTGAASQQQGETVIGDVADQAEKVADLLDEYKTKGK